MISIQNPIFRIDFSISLRFMLIIETDMKKKLWKIL